MPATPNYAGAVAAIQQVMKDNWSDTPVLYQNEPTPEGIWPPVENDGQPKPWAYFEVETVSDGKSDYPHATGKPGDQVWLTSGFISITIFEAVNTGSSSAFALAVAAGELFRAKSLYDATPGYCVRTWGPRVDGGGRQSDDGNWFRVTVMVPFEYWHRG